MIVLTAALAAAAVAISWPDRRRRIVALVAFVAVGAATAIVLAHRGLTGFPISDTAVIEIYTREALSGRLLVGPYSRFGWHHPGPLYFYVLAPIYVLGGEKTAALNAGALTLSLVAVAIITWTSARIAGEAVSTAFLAVVTAYVWRVSELVDSAWNPHVVVLQTIALLVVSAALSCGDFAALPFAAVIASFVIQTDVALVPLASAILAVSTAAALAATRREPPNDAAVRVTGHSLAITAWLMAIVWFIPTAEQVSHTPGNMTALWQFFVDRPGHGQPLGTATAAWASMLTAVLRPGFSLATGAVVAPDTSGLPIVLALALMLLAAIAAVWAFRARRQGLAWLATLSVVGAIVTLWSTTRIDGSINDHMIFWFAAVGGANIAVCGGALLTWMQQTLDPGHRTARLVAPLAHSVPLGVLLWIGLCQVDRARQGSFPATVTSPAIPNFANSIRRYLRDSGVQRPLVRIDQEQWGMAAGILLELQRHDIPFAIEDSWASMFPDRFRATGHEDLELTIAAAGARPELAARPANVTIDVSRQVHVEAIKVEPSSHPQ